MLLTTAAVHSGASGGAVADAATGQLLGLVTSNAKHKSRGDRSSGSSGGSGSSDSRRGGDVSADGSSSSMQTTVLPHLNFSIPAAQLGPVLLAASEAAAAEATGGGAMGGSAGDAAAVATWRQLDAAGAANAELNQVWRMDPRQQQRQRQQEGGSGGVFGGAAPPTKLQRLLEQLAEQEQGQQAPASLCARL
ncbi:hypothetical protein COHA_002906 [Chlorella ohadii]|uniref:Uncharacterized protein n=1 Tax=Chlorella ohadii TaxID=2649997 RepID=A0AAD5DVS3_9CHLO|nr:hypothetical protein COHA_002906 [Chlorella ohadii]